MREKDFKCGHCLHDEIKRFNSTCIYCALVMARAENAGSGMLVIFSKELVEEIK